MTQPTRTALLNAALDTAARGWHVHPLRPGGKASALHGEGACPRTGECVTRHRKWEQRATLDPDRIRAAWAVRGFNVGIAPGPAGLLVVDLDMLKPDDEPDTPDGVTAFQALCERAGQAVPATHTVRTPSGGMHLYFATPPAIRMPSSKGRLAAKIDTRGWGGNVVAAGSVVDGRPYETADGRLPVPLPEWLLTELMTRQNHSQPLSLALPGHSSRYATVALEREAAAVAAAREGSREAELFRAARAMGRFVAWGDLDRHTVEAAFQFAGESAGLPPTQCRSTLRSALNWSITHAAPRRTA